MKRAIAVALIAVGVALLSAVSAQTPTAAKDRYLFIDATETRGRLSRTVDLRKVGDQLEKAGLAGYGLQAMAGFSSSVNLLLRDEGTAPRRYRLVAEGREGRFLERLNEAGADGFRVIPHTVKALEEGGSYGRRTTWLAVLVAEEGAPVVTYSVAKGATEGAAALALSAAPGHRLVGVLGRIGLVAANTLVFVETAEADATASALGDPADYRVLATARTSTLEADLSAAEAEGFRVLKAGFGYMTVAMARALDPAPERVEYRLIAMQRVATAERELRENGAAGYRIAATSENGEEGVFVLHRTPGTTQRYDYRVLRLRAETANQVLVDAEAEGFQVAGLLNELVVLEKGL